MNNTKNIISKLPTTPGVYFFKNKAGDILYVGKATSLRDRVRSYFSNDIMQTRGPLIYKMLTEYTKVDFIATDSVLEALILEANLIKKHQPIYNSKEKDNKSYNYVIFTNDFFPKILVMRGRTMYATFPKDNIKYIFGPFPHGTQLKEAVVIIRKIFPFSDKKCVPSSEQIKKGKTPKPCFNRQIGLCPGVCTGEIDKNEYAETIKNLKLFFEGKKKEVLKNLKIQMNLSAKKHEFEKASEIKKTIFALNHIQDIALLKRGIEMGESVGGEMLRNVNNKENKKMFRIEAYDVAHLAGTNVVGVMTVMEDGEMIKQEYRKFKIKINPGINDISALKEIIDRRLKHTEWPFPQLIVVDGGRAQINAAQVVLQKHGLNIDVISVVKDEKHKPRDLMGDREIIEKHQPEALLVNNEAHRFAISFHRTLRRRTML